MQVTESKADGLKHEFKIVVPAAAIQEKVDARLIEIGHTVRLPGFRPGKAPMNILKKKYGPAALKEVVEDTVNDGVRKAFEDNKIRPAMNPDVKIDEFKDGADLVFSLAVENLPDIQVIDLSSLELEKKVAKVTDEMIDGRLANIARHFGETESLPSDHAAVEGDITVIDFLGKVDDVPFEGGKGEAHRLTLGSKSFIPGFEDQLIGSKAGEERAVKVTFPADYHATELAGKEAIFEVKITEVKRLKPAELDDELAKNLNLQTIDEVKDMVRSGVEREHQSLSRAHLKRALLDKLASSHDFPLPENMANAEFQAIWEQVKKAREEDRLDPDDKGKSDEELEAEYRKIAERRVRLGLLVAEIGRANNVAVSQEDMNRAMVEEARRYPGQEQLVLQYFRKNPETAESLRAPLYEEKVVDFILELAKITEREVSVEELERDPEESAEHPVEKPAPKKTRKKKAETAEGE
ncbi:trigger factor [Alphaproteobacteria bacterium]|nr:trigger factor [Alphaproteobacteria bacterium]